MRVQSDDERYARAACGGGGGGGRGGCSANLRQCSMVLALVGIHAIMDKRTAIIVMVHDDIEGDLVW